jgi:hypothetical protein
VTESIRDIPEEMVEKGAASIDDLLTMLGVDPGEWNEHGGPTTAEVLSRTVLSAALAGRTVVDLPEPELDTGTLAAWRPQMEIVEAWADSQAIPLVRHNGATKVAHVARETALALLAATERAEQLAAGKSAAAESVTQKGDDQ